MHLRDLPEMIQSGAPRALALVLEGHARFLDPILTDSQGGTPAGAGISMAAWVYKTVRELSQTIPALSRSSPCCISIARASRVTEA